LKPALKDITPKGGSIPGKSMDQPSTDFIPNREEIPLSITNQTPAPTESAPQAGCHKRPKAQDILYLLARHGQASRDSLRDIQQAVERLTPRPSTWTQVSQVLRCVVWVTCLAWMVAVLLLMLGAATVNPTSSLGILLSSPWACALLLFGYLPAQAFDTLLRTFTP
jgi:hypothetical protein